MSRATKKSQSRSRRVRRRAHGRRASPALRSPIAPLDESLSAASDVFLVHETSSGDDGRRLPDEEFFAGEG